MKVLFFGDRYWVDDDIIRDIMIGLGLGLQDIVVHGGAPGADSIAGEVAEELGVKVEEHPANWELYGRAAGPKRNKEMAECGIELAYGFHDDIANSKGTKNMMGLLKKRTDVRAYLISHI